MVEKNMDVRSVAQLARVALTEEEIETFTGQLGRVVEHITRLGQVDVSGVEPTAHANPVFNVMREDIPGESISREDFLSITPLNAHHLVIVPKVLE